MGGVYSLRRSTRNISKLQGMSHGRMYYGRAPGEGKMQDIAGAEARIGDRVALAVLGQKKAHLRLGTIIDINAGRAIIQTKGSHPIERREGKFAIVGFVEDSEELGWITPR